MFECGAHHKFLSRTVLQTFSLYLAGLRAGYCQKKLRCCDRRPTYFYVNYTYDTYKERQKFDCTHTATILTFLTTAWETPDN